jgi:hypothetical protein
LGQKSHLIDFLNPGFNLLGGFQLEFVSISRVINHMNCYNLSDLIGGFFFYKILCNICSPV